MRAETAVHYIWLIIQHLKGPYHFERILDLSGYGHICFKKGPLFPLLAMPTLQPISAPIHNIFDDEMMYINSQHFSGGPIFCLTIVITTQMISLSTIRSIFSN